MKNNKKMKKLAGVLSIVMLMGLTGASAFAATTTDDAKLDTKDNCTVECDNDANQKHQYKGEGKQGEDQRGEGIRQQNKDGHMLKLVAEVTGLSEDAVKEKHEAGETLGQIAKDAGKLDELKAAILKDKTAKVDDLLKDGKITEDRAENMKKNMEEKVKNFDENTKNGLGGRGQNRGQQNHENGNCES